MLLAAMRRLLIVISVFFLAPNLQCLADAHDTLSEENTHISIETNQFNEVPSLLFVELNSDDMIVRPPFEVRLEYYASYILHIGLGTASGARLASGRYAVVAALGHDKFDGDRKRIVDRPNRWFCFKEWPILEIKSGYLNRIGRVGIHDDDAEFFTYFPRSGALYLSRENNFSDLPTMDRAFEGTLEISRAITENYCQ